MFWPGLLAITGVMSPIALLVNIVTSYDPSLSGAGSPLTILLVLPIVAIVAATFLGFSVLLLVERDHVLVWGAVVAGLYGLPLLVLTPLSLSALLQPCCSNTTSSDWFWFAAETIPLAVGLTGGVWGILREVNRHGVSNPVKVRAPKRETATWVTRIILASSS